MARNPRGTFDYFSQMPESIRGRAFGKLYRHLQKRTNNSSHINITSSPISINPLTRFFDNHAVGRGIWKWDHYFDIYHTHFSKFVGKRINILEIGVYSGGSLEMWREYFGDKCRVYGVDIAEICKAYNNEHTEIFIGDQAERRFWRDFTAKVPQIDILLDDGGHTYNQQIVTLEEMLPHINPGGVYVCEDIHGTNNGFNSYCQGLIKNLNEMTPFDPEVGAKAGMQPNLLQAWIEGIYFYPFMTVIAKAERPIEKLIAPRRGTLWQPINTT